MKSIKFDIMNEYIDLAQKKLKIAKNFDVQYFGMCIPKNAIYGRISKFYYIYVTDFLQFKDTKKTIFSIRAMDTRKHGKFQYAQIKKHSLLYNYIIAMLEFNEWYNTKIQYQYCINRIEKPVRKEPQTKTGYMYKTGLYCQNRVDKFCNTCIDTDVAAPRRRYV